MGRRLKEMVSKEETPMAKKKKSMKRWSTSLIIRKMYIKTTVKKNEKKMQKNYSEVSPHHSQNDHHQNNKYWRGCGEKGTLHHCWWECKLVKPLWRKIWRFL